MKIGDILAELSFPQNHNPSFLVLKQKQELKTIHVNHSNKENYNNPFSKEKLIRVIQVTKKSSAGPNKIYNEMFTHLPSEGLDFFLALHCRRNAQLSWGICSEQVTSACLPKQPFVTL